MEKMLSTVKTTQRCLGEENRIIEVYMTETGEVYFDGKLLSGHDTLAEAKKTYDILLKLLGRYSGQVENALASQRAIENAKEFYDGLLTENFEMKKQIKRLEKEAERQKTRYSSLVRSYNKTIHVRDLAKAKLEEYFNFITPEVEGVGNTIDERLKALEQEQDSREEYELEQAERE